MARFAQACDLNWIVYRFSDIAGGYLCFVVSIFGIGVVTAVIGDVASYFGCTLGIKDSVTAVAFVALGTSIPGELSEFMIFSGMEGTGGASFL